MTGQEQTQVTPEIVFLAPREVADRVALSTRTIQRYVKKGLFPQPVNLSESRIAFVEAEIVAWQRRQMEARPA